MKNCFAFCVIAFHCVLSLDSAKGQGNINAGLLAHFTFDSPSESGNPSPSMDFFPHVGGMSAHFDEDTDYISLGTFQLEDTATIAFWFSASKHRTQNFVSSRVGPDGDSGIGIGEWAPVGQPLRFVFSAGNSESRSTGSRLRTLAEPYALGYWRHMAGTFSRSGEMRLYLDGNLIASHPTPKDRPIADHPLYVGADPRDPDGEKYSLRGRIDEVRIYDRVLNQEEIQILAERDMPPELYGDGWRHNKINGNFYKLTEESLSRQDAALVASSEFATLATISSPEEEAWLIDAFLEGDEEIWIGLGKDQVDGAWKWEDESDFLYANWKPGYPSDSGERAAVMTREGWESKDGSVERRGLISRGIDQTEIQPIDIPQIDPDELGRNLVIFTHGWNGKFESEDGNETTVWEKMEAELTMALEGTNWRVLPYPWESDAATITPVGARLNAIQHGVGLGTEISDYASTNNIEKVHLIGHSAGAWLIQNASRVLRESLGKAITVQCTFLDAFNPWPTGLGAGESPIIGLTPRNQLGLYGDFSEHVFDESERVDYGDVIGSNLSALVFLHTRSRFKNMININVTGRFSGDSTDVFQTHAWPVHYYAESIRDRAMRAEGFAQSISQGAMPQFGGTYERSSGDALNIMAGDEIQLLPDGSTVKKHSIISQFVTLVSDAYLDFQSIDVSRVVGDVVLGRDRVLLETASPAIVSVPVELTGSSEFLVTDFEFLGEVGSHGVLFVIWDGLLLAKIDERFWEPGVHSLELRLPPGTSGQGTHELTFRLEPFSETQSSIEISKVGLAEVRTVSTPEPQISSSSWTVTLKSKLSRKIKKLKKKAKKVKKKGKKRKAKKLKKKMRKLKKRLRRL